MADTRFKIGDSVLCSAVASMQYDEYDSRICHREPCEPFLATVTGRCTRFLGTYRPRSRGYSMGYDPPDDNPAHLQVKGSVRLWCVRKWLCGKELLIADEDIKESGLG